MPRDKDDLSGKKAEIDDDLETAEAKSRSVDERVPEHYAKHGVGPDAPVPTAGVPQGPLVGPPGTDLGEGEVVLDKERQAQRTPRRPG